MTTSYIKKYTNWLHGQWPSGTVEKLPIVNADGTTNIPGIYIVGDLKGTPLLKFSADSGAKALHHIQQQPSFHNRKVADDTYDVIIVGGGVSGYAAALEAKKSGLKILVLEASSAFSTIKNFPKSKPIYTYPTMMKPEGQLRFDGDIGVKETLLASLATQIESEQIPIEIAAVSHVQRKAGIIQVHGDDLNTLKAHRVVIAIGRSGKYRQLDVPGFDFDKVVNRLHDPKTYADKNIIVVGGGDSALESAIATSEQGANVTLSYRGRSFSRAKAENIDRIHALADKQALRLEMGSKLSNIEKDHVTINTMHSEKRVLKNDFVLAMIGREAPLEFFRRSGIDIAGTGTIKGWVFLTFFLLLCIAVYDWKGFGFFQPIWNLISFPNNMPGVLSGLSDWWSQQVNDRSTLLGTVATSMLSRSFYYTVIYTSCIAIFGWLRIKRRNTPYVTLQTWTLFLVQLIPLFLLPEVILPWLGYLGVYDSGVGRVFADSLFPSYISSQDLANHVWPDWGHPRAYWHAYGFILAWPLNVYNVFTDNPIWGWIVISALQTFVIIPLLIYKWGKGAYCGWICSCGALAETVGDTHRHKMPHGPFWNKLNMLGQFILLGAFILLLIRIGGWLYPDTWMNTTFNLLLKGENNQYQTVNPLSWKWAVDVLLGGILGVGLYFKFSGRTWCRFACPLAALMHIYARFSRFRIFADKSKCISCNACTSVCHQGIDVMSFANKGRPMEDPECVRCSACIQSCPTGVLSFGEIDKHTGTVRQSDQLVASSVQMFERIPVKHVS